VARDRRHRFRGTFAPDRRACDNPIAIACFRLFTLRPEPDRRRPRLRSCIAAFTFLDAALPYLRRLELFRLAMDHLRATKGPRFQAKADLARR